MLHHFVKHLAEFEMSHWQKKGLCSMCAHLFIVKSMCISSTLTLWAVATHMLLPLRSNWENYSPAVLLSPLYYVFLMTDLCFLYIDYAKYVVLI